MGRSRWDQLARTARGAVALALVVVPLAEKWASWATAGAPEPSPSATVAEWTPVSWRPPDADIEWADAVVTHYDENTLGACVQGGLYEWNAPGGLRVGLEWLGCDDPAAAAAVIPSVLLQGNFPEAGITPVFGTDIDVATYQASGSHLLRFWSQDGHYFSLARNCGMTPECAAATALYATDLASQIDAAFNDLPWVVPARDPLAEFRPSGDSQDWARIQYFSIRGTADERPECDDGASVTWMARDGTIARVFWWGCASTDIAFRGFNHWWQNSGMTLRPDLEGVLGSQTDRAGIFREGRGLARSWVQGTSYANVQRECPGELTAACVEASEADALAVEQLLDGPVHPDDRVTDQLVTAGIIFILIPVGTLLALFVLRVAAGNVGQRGYAVVPEGSARFTAVDKPVRRARLGRWVRRAVLIVGTSAAWIGLLLTVTGWNNVLLFGIVFFGGPPILYAVFTLLLRLVWRPSAIARAGWFGRGRLGLVGSTGAGLSIAARVIGVLGIVSYLLMCALVIYTDAQLPSVNDEQIASMRALGPLGAVWAQAQQLAVNVSETGQEWMLFALFVVLPATVAYFIDRLGRRLRRRSLPATLAADTRPYFLYLRGFDEDRLRTTSSLTRRGFIESFTPFARPRFEEVLVEYLSRFGPVIAISPRDQRLPDLGAAKVSLEGDAWQDHVREWVGGAQAVVMAATPGEVRRGLAWEIEYIAQHDLTPRVMLVVAPWRRAELLRRWRGFVDHAAQWPLFAPLAADPMPSGVQLLTWTTERGWSGYGARRRWDWTYAASILRALEDAQPSWTRDREAEHIDATALIEQAEGAQHPGHSELVGAGAPTASGPDDSAGEGN